MLDRQAFLGVVHSATARRWVGPDAGIERMGLAIAQAADVPEIVGRILAARDVAPEDAADYLAPTLRGLMPDPSSLADMDAAADRLAHAALNGERVAIFGDYDVDGASAAAMLFDWLASFGIEARLHIPDRMTEGYGPNIPAMQRLGAEHDLVICVDCGTMAHEPVAAARAAGADVIIADHHLPGETLPDALAVVNPNRVDCPSGLGQLCAAGVVFLILVAANRVLRAGGKTGPDLLSALDLVAVATVADVAPLTGLNRAFVRQGLCVMAGRQRPGLAALADVAGLRAPPRSSDLGFVLGP
ncbi:MAG: DHH family phosphoesterase, partial [Pseudomonadota bacterium]